MVCVGLFYAFGSFQQIVKLVVVCVDFLLKKRLAWVLGILEEYKTIYVQKTTTCDRTVARFLKFVLE